MKKVLGYVSQASILGITFTLGLVSNASAMTIKPDTDGHKLANAIVGEGITVTPGSIDYTGAAGSAGFFDDGMSSGIGIKNGIVLTTGLASDAMGSNDADNTTTNNGSAGDADLNQLIDGIFTQDASVLEFDFESEGGDLFFDFVFASEEYNEFVNTGFNDVFGFFLDGENIALIPGTDTPVAINTVNGGNPFGKDASNPDLYNNNDPDDPGPANFNIEYDGFTDVFKAKALKLSPGTHTIKLAVADVGDTAFDSAVFIAANSFSDVENPDPDPDPNPDPDTAKTPEPASIFSLLALGLVGSRSLFKRKLSFRK
jgi:hypothetical protein